MLMPAAVLIMVVLGAVCVDRAVIFGAQRELVATAQAAASDAASLGVDIDRLRADGGVEPDLDEMAHAVALATAGVPAGTTVTWDLRGGTVDVHLERDVKLVFSPGVPGGRHTTHVEATASAELRRR